MVTIKKIKIYLYLIFFAIISISCSDEKGDNLGEKKTNFASRRIYNANITLTDSVYAIIRLRTPLMEEYEFVETPYTVFPKGLDMDFYQKGKDPGHLKADYAKIIENAGWYEARKNVVIINSDKDTLKTNQIFWNKKERKIFSNDTVKIYRADGVTTNISIHGIESSEDFKNFKLKKNTGTLPYANDLKTDSK
ncbi:LPS export ABC transporter periplasmic protein LptC [Apibacter sp. B3889]|uniref:LPS export ABC transporter periplasmic protein LptC n=1 Tax=unclassified Apibacter TaxID=2630820 RepID=UPI001327E4A0|nr:MULTISPECIES: LPS export ABC transporter periplasmic protein LptC [unclassified Apibacter]MXO34433.1 LPS export ABC transporter periplasmic protein LptC [Apibacter sp. B3883]MXO41436.1 LPS export ABC transporter periplasmic protein LptC [Apibacter sp. B3889]MXP03006.1 LPS export ABC transporter periplasmic protein LptC [Apibacter sp. B3887]MXP07731.1 LPS export ABC transporter periplasmic protein LptC [Apibacter sp. B3935]